MCSYVVDFNPTPVYATGMVTGGGGGSYAQQSAMPVAAMPTAPTMQAVPAMMMAAPSSAVAYAPGQQNKSGVTAGGGSLPGGGIDISVNVNMAAPAPTYLVAPSSVAGIQGGGAQSPSAQPININVSTGAPASSPYAIAQPSVAGIQGGGAAQLGPAQAVAAQPVAVQTQVAGAYANQCCVNGGGIAQQSPDITQALTTVTQMLGQVVQMVTQLVTLMQSRATQTPPPPGGGPGAQTPNAQPSPDAGKGDKTAPGKEMSEDEKKKVIEFAAWYDKLSAEEKANADKFFAQKPAS